VAAEACIEKATAALVEEKLAAALVEKKLAAALVKGGAGYLAAVKVGAAGGDLGGGGWRWG
jgi:hypothetical protein